MATGTSGKIAIVTGASRGIGKAISLAYAKEGAMVVVAARSETTPSERLPGSIHEMVEEIEALGGRALAVRCDVTDEASVDAMVEKTLAEFGRVDVLVNNAAVDFPSKVVDMAAKRWEVVFRVGLPPLARFVSFAVGGVDPGVMGIGPVVAIPKALKLAGLTVDDLDLVELNKAFASQAVYVIRHLGLDPERTNVNGGAISLGHPLGATGSKLTTTLLYEMHKRQSRYGCVTMCAAGGTGAAAIFERL